MTASVASPWVKWIARLALVAGLVVALAFLGIFALFALSGMAHVEARATSPDGVMVARAERQGGSMQFPWTSIFIRRSGAADCLALRWSAEGSGRESGAVRIATLQWRDDRTLLVGADVPPPVLAGSPCGVRVMSAGSSVQ